MNGRLTATALCVLLALPVRAAGPITEAQIKQVIDATDAAAMKRDAAGIGLYLGESFEKVIEFQLEKWMAKVRIDRDKYLAMIDSGWAECEAYDYRRADTEIHIMPDGLSGQTYSTIIEHVVKDGRQMTSKVREYATYELENGRPVITEISGYTLVGDTTPY